ADDRHLRAAGKLTRELDREGVHRDRADDPAMLVADEDARAGEVTAKAVRVPDGNMADPRLALGDELPAVARRLARPQQLHERELAPPRQDHPPPVLG